jgi:hypothetical protein
MSNCESVTLKPKRVGGGCETEEVCEPLHKRLRRITKMELYKQFIQTCILLDIKLYWWNCRKTKRDMGTNMNETLCTDHSA